MKSAAVLSTATRPETSPKGYRPPRTTSNKFMIISHKWTTADGEKMWVDQMADSHLRNAFWYSVRKIGFWAYRVLVLGLERVARRMR